MTFGETLQELRQSLGLRQGAVADGLRALKNPVEEVHKASQSLVSRWESDLVRPSPEAVEQIVEVLGRIGSRRVTDAEAADLRSRREALRPRDRLSMLLTGRTADPTSGRGVQVMVPQHRVVGKHRFEGPDGRRHDMASQGERAEGTAVVIGHDLTLATRVVGRLAEDGVTAQIRSWSHTDDWDKRGGDTVAIGWFSNPRYVESPDRPGRKDPLPRWGLSQDDVTGADLVLFERARAGRRATICNLGGLTSVHTLHAAALLEPAIVDHLLASLDGVDDRSSDISAVVRIPYVDGVADPRASTIHPWLGAEDTSRRSTKG